MAITIIIIIAVIALPLVIALFIPKEYNLERIAIINAPKHKVFDYIKYVRNQEQYSKWAMADPDQKITTTGTDGTVGFINAWDSAKKAGAGEQEITGLIDGERITTELRFTRPFKNTGHSYMATETHNQSSTKVTWGLSGKMPYPLNLMTALLKGGLAKDIDLSLNNLKQILEENSK
ncbi:SRPBCC family protein [Flavobacterium psychrotrophum]|uniref:SRPBCC family protein n=1 Tax=Flavobacterium psychrotrophum TaxID=2294119 RepID=UPI000E320B81|nr:SRPBCC family protein [Flavobacterium psychrotrophum]